ncbi:hypothetical protein P7K49_013960 [Saguinus oedipus]|uniref:OBG-type G domain-containing protein n=1 Tax=Saguinus oedipus TaxID=9490 RepID=A0ABQ9VI69_SAGOE|nr:hypothetical protein P7K49_013960 [Saguinus oedipus]
MSRTFSAKGGRNLAEGPQYLAGVHPCEKWGMWVNEKDQIPDYRGMQEKELLLDRMPANAVGISAGIATSHYMLQKSTFFNVLTNSQASAENFPFCTIDPNESRVPVPDERFDFLCQYHKPASKIPAFLNVVDIAGLVKGAHNGQGLGNAFLSHISACDGIFHLTHESWVCKSVTMTLMLLSIIFVSEGLFHSKYMLC